MSDERMTAEQKLRHWIKFAESNRPGHDSLRGVSYEPAPIRQKWLAEVLDVLAAERHRADRAEAALAEANTELDDMHEERECELAAWREDEATE